MKRYFISALTLLISLAGCTRETPEQPSETLDGKMVISVGYENMALASSTSSKTVLTERNAIHWAASDADKLLYVFDRVREFTKSDFFIGMLITAAGATVIYIVASAVIRGSRPGNGKKRPRRNPSRKNGGDRLGGGTPGRR